MSDHQDFIAKAKHQIAKLGDELKELERQVKDDCKKSGDWYESQMTKLRNEWSEAQSQVERLASDTHAEAKASYQQVRADTERHWQALEAAVKAYRDRVEKDAA